MVPRRRPTAPTPEASLTIRPATSRDLAAILDTEAASNSSWPRAAVEPLLAEERAICLVTDTPAGHVLATAVLDEGEILTVAVHPSARRHGHARALLLALEAAWRARGIETGWLEVREDNVAARALYAATGWQSSGRRRAYYADGTDALVLRRVLSAPR